MSIFSKSVPIFLGTMLSFQTQAVTINYDNWVYNNSPQEVDWNVTISDERIPGSFTVVVQNTDTFNPGAWQGDITGFGFNTNLNYGTSILDDISTTTAPLGSCSGNCNWNGTAAANPDYSFSVGAPGASAGGSPDVYDFFGFAIPDLGATLDENTFSLVAIRGQSIGFGGLGGGSVKDYSTSGTLSGGGGGGGGGGGHSVPELSASMAPLSAALLMGLMMFGAERRRKKA